MEAVGIYAARTHLARLVRRVAGGERIAITRHGVPVAVLVPPGAESRPDPAQVIEKIRRFQGRHTLGGLSWRQLVEEGRRI